MNCGLVCNKFVPISFSIYSVDWNWSWRPDAALVLGTSSFQRSHRCLYFIPLVAAELVLNENLVLRYHFFGRNRIQKIWNFGLFFLYAYLHSNSWADYGHVLVLKGALVLVIFYNYCISVSDFFLKYLGLTRLCRYARVPNICMDFYI